MYNLVLNSKVNSELKNTDKDLWEAFTKNIKKIESDKVVKTIDKKIFVLNAKEISDRTVTTAKNCFVCQLSRKDLRNMEIEKILDLHGFSEQKAYEAMKIFLKHSYEQQIRWLLVITGKGSINTPGILKKQLPKWLEELSAIASGYCQAAPKYGGEGAFYIKIRRKRI